VRFLSPPYRGRERRQQDQKRSNKGWALPITIPPAVRVALPTNQQPNCQRQGKGRSGTDQTT